MELDASSSQRRTAALYNVPQSTISNRHTGPPCQRNNYPESSALTKPGRNALLMRIKGLFLRRHTSTYAEVCDMADHF
jgi:hypothetical protein